MDRTGEITGAIDALSARLDALQASCEQLARENVHLRRLLGEPGAGRAGRDSVSAAMDSGDGVSRRRLLRTAAAVSAAAAGAVALDRADPAKAADGSNILAGKKTTAESATELHFDGTSNPEMFFLANDTSFDSSAAAYPAALGGWASGSTVTNGIYGYTAADGGSAVVGQLGFGTSSGNGVLGVAAGAGGAGVLGTNSAGTGVAGSSDSRAPDATAIIGTITSTSPGGNATAVRGQNNGTGGNGIGVYGSHDGSGLGGYFTSVAGVGVQADGQSGRGVVASGDAAQIQRPLVPGRRIPPRGRLEMSTSIRPLSPGSAWVAPTGFR